MSSMLESLNLSDLDALLREAKKIKKSRAEQAFAELVEMVGPNALSFAEAIVASADYRESEGSPWSGYSISKIPVTVDGVDYTVSATLTDAARTEQRRPEFAEKK